MSNSESATGEGEDPAQSDRDPPEALAELLADAVSSLEASHAGIAREVAELRRQRKVEEQLVSVLSRQRDELHADVSEAQAALSKVTSELEAARNALETAEESQVHRREETLRAVMSGVESLLRGGMESIGKDLKDHHDLVRSSLVNATTHSATSSALATQSEERASTAGDAACRLATSWATSSDAACDSIALAQEVSREATQQVHSAATERVNGLVSVVEQLKAAQDAVQPKWTASRDAAAAAVSTWSAQEKAAVQSLREVAAKTALAIQEAEVLHQEVGGHCAKAEAQATERAQQDQHHTALLAGLHELHAGCSQEEDSTEARHLGVLSALGESALAIAEVATQQPVEAEALLGAVQAQAASAIDVANRHAVALQSVETAVCKLGPQAEAAHEQIVQHVSQLQASGIASHRDAAQSASRMAEEVVGTLQSATNALSAQKAAFIKADAAAEERWLALERSHGDVLKVMETAGAAARAESNMFVAQGDTSREEEVAHQAQQKVASELKEHRDQLATALVEHQRLWLSGLSENPMLAFTDDAIFEDQLANEMPSETPELLPHIVQELSTQRKSEQALSAEFYVSHNQNTMLHKEEETPIRLETPIRRSPSSKVMGKHPADEASSGYPRTALRELQVGGAPPLPSL